MIPVVIHLAFLAVTATAGSAACHPIEGERITAADLAAVLPAFASVAPDTLVGYAPQPGAYRNIEPAELTRFAAAHGLEFHGIETVCFEPAVSELEASQIEASIRASLSTIAISSAEVEIVDYSKFHVPSGKLSFPIESLPAYSSANTAVWNGFVEHEHRRYPVWARVRITAPQTRVVTLASLRTGQLVEAGDVRLEEARIFPTRAVFLQSLSDCVGKLARRYLTTGSPMIAGDLMEPFDVDRGQIAIVEVQSGGAVLTVEAEAQAAGRQGQSIAFKNSVSGKIFSAKITGKGRALLECRSTGN